MKIACRRLQATMSDDESLHVIGNTLQGTTNQILRSLPDHLAMECLSRVPLSTLRRVNKIWQNLIYDPYFQSLRAANGRSQLDWVYTLVQSQDLSFKWQAFDPLSGLWHDLPPTPRPMEFQLNNPGCIGVSYSVQCASSRTKLVMVAGLKAKQHDKNRMTMEPALSHPYIYDTQTCQWKLGYPFTVPRKWCVCGVTEEKLYIASGSGKDWDRELSKSAEVYNLKSDSWKKIQNLSTSKFSGEAMTAVSNDNKLYFVSGRGVFSKEGVVYNIATDSWSEMAPGLKKGWTGLCVTVNGKFYSLETPAGKLKVHVPEKDCWDVIMEDSRLGDVEVLVSTKDKIVGIEGPGKSVQPSDRSILRVIDIACETPRIFDIPMHQGKIVSVQVLAPMSRRL
ncbi:F-box/kelch-repeat protein SKIP25 [Physcomitrium patens]|uniref:F-box domain-containing protein n=1 Tax=Physcomitrium patens TaxID=3218 RepID=A0A2K1JU34_PHYPA|nr:F-box/kelch-repeat protein SKIP25-like [Physcomitrium patens]PNR45042.1 hypothetical protein PHYPA_014813 [Physcomitrium patens]|eukprot:XP_024388199.1 F-box/kelch-repeat protein SKIP25-like [Physcomitrella patens]